MNIHFICKHNIFRSKIAECYLKKRIKDPKIKVTSSGIVLGIGMNDHQKSIIRLQRKAARKHGITIKGKPMASTVGDLSKKDLVIIVANDIPIELFSYSSYIKKVIKWDVYDVGINDAKKMDETVMNIIENVDNLVSELRYRFNIKVD